MSMKNILDSLYGEVSFDEDILSLIQLPVLQRLRHVRLSNIDSLNMPGIANLSRYEHVLGVGHLAGQLSFYNRLSREDRLALSASALLHDWAITSFGHLVEEALNYVGTGFHHENRLYEMVIGEDQEEIGGVERQILVGRQTKLLRWVRKVVGPDRANEFLQGITNYMRGHGRFGRLICGDIDLDNIDSVFRMAYHMGLPVDRECPLRLARSILDVSGRNGNPVFRRSAEPDIVQWLSTRHAVYERLMLADADFTGKLMILYATVSAFEADEIGKLDWSLTDDELLQRLRTSAGEGKETVKRWLAGELWNGTPLYWMAGRRPDFPEVLSFSRELSSALSRPCFAYCIKDKRDRLLKVRFEDGASEEFGTDSLQWLFGVGSPVQRPFRVAEIDVVIDLAQMYFSTSVISAAREPGLSKHLGDEQQCLL